MMDRLQCVLHNHPSGDPAPSRADVQMTQAIVDITKRLGIAVHDHIIVGKETGRLPVDKPRPANRSSRKQPKQIAAVHESGSGPEPTSRDVHSAVAIRGKADLTRTSKFGRDDPQSRLGKPARETTRMMATSARRWTTKCFEFCFHA